MPLAAPALQTWNGGRRQPAIARKGSKARGGVINGVLYLPYERASAYKHTSLLQRDQGTVGIKTAVEPYSYSFASFCDRTITGK